MKLQKIATVGALSFPGFVFAAPPDLSTLTAAVDLTTVGAAILAIGALLMAPQIIKYAVSAVRRMFPR